MITVQVCTTFPAEHDKQEDQITYFPQYVSDMQSNVSLNIVAWKNHVLLFIKLMRHDAPYNNTFDTKIWILLTLDFKSFMH